jgi:DNA polymerase-4
MPRYILHVDMDAFFAAIEQCLHPEYRNKPVIVGADPKQGRGRGVVSTCSYEARVFGVHSAMPINQAYRLCPHGIYVPPNGKLYSQVSNEILALFYDYTDMVEPLSIDEAFLDITGSLGLFDSCKSLALSLKQKIYKKQGLTASVGVAPNKFIAKIASDLKKPDGLVIVDEMRIDTFLKPLDISRLWGAGKKTIEKLNTAGIRTIGDLSQYPLDVLEQIFGKLGKHFFQLAHGIDDRPVIPEHVVKSVSNEVTFEKDIDNKTFLNKTLLKLSEKVGYRLREQNLKGKTIHLKLRYQGFETITRNRTIKYLTSNTEYIYEVVRDLLDKNLQKGRKVRLLGVGVSGFVDELGHQLSLFEGTVEQDNRIDKLADMIKNKFGKKAISRAASLKNNATKN